MYVIVGYTHGECLPAAHSKITVDSVGSLLAEDLVAVAVGLDGHGVEHGVVDIESYAIGRVEQVKVAHAIGR